MAAQTLLALAWRFPHAAELGNDIAVPLLVTLVYAFVWADAGDAETPSAAIWERVLERAWAVILIDFVFGWVFSQALLLSASSDPLQLIAGLAGFIVTVVMVFADVSATVDDDVTVWTLLPRALMQSVTASWNPVTFARALALIALQLLLLVAQSALYAAFDHYKIPDALFWAEIPILTLTAAPISALTVLVYRDARAAEERQSP